jgi:hypothetical protein
LSWQKADGAFRRGVQSSQQANRARAKAQER